MNETLGDNSGKNFGGSCGGVMRQGLKGNAVMNKPAAIKINEIKLG